nr:site-specific integrase [Flavobacterium sp. NKUCC04_CG]
MKFLTQNGFLDTNLTQKKFLVAINSTFALRATKNKDGKSLLYLILYSKGSRERISLDLYVHPKDWSKSKQMIISKTEEARDFNLVLDNINAKITNIKTVYRLNDQPLSVEMLKKEFIDGVPRINFVLFFEQALKGDEILLKPGTYRRYVAVLNKLRAYKEEIPFHDIDLKFITDYRKHLKSIGNLTTTINSNIIVLKKYLREARKSGIKLKMDIDLITGGSTTGNRTALNPVELKKFDEYYFSSFIHGSTKLTLGYFLFSCMTGLRLGDILELNRKDLGSEIQFKASKTGKDQIISLNNKALEIIHHDPELFVTRVHPNVMNRDLKEIAKTLGVRKHISYHISRHTFATNFLRMGGQAAKLQVLMGHSKMETTMIYVHILAAEANKEIFLLDKLF